MLAKRTWGPIVKRKAAERFWGRQGGGFAGDQEVPFEGIPMVCSCRHLWFVAPRDIGQPCWGCGEPLRLLDTTTTTHSHIDRPEFA